MDILTLASELRDVADLVVTDEAGRSLLLVEIEAGTDRESGRLARLRADQRRFGFPFAMLAAPDSIRLFGQGESDEPAAHFSTPETLRSFGNIHQEPRYRAKDEILWPLGRWLQASTFDYLTDRHPGYCCLQRVGLVEKINWGHVLAKEMLSQPAGATEPSF